MVDHLLDGSEFVGFHTHDHDHDHDYDGSEEPFGHESASLDAGMTPAAHGSDHHHDGHSHPVFNMLAGEIASPVFGAIPNTPPSGVLLSPASHIPPQLDRPPPSLA